MFVPIVISNIALTSSIASLHGLHDNIAIIIGLIAILAQFLFLCFGTYYLYSDEIKSLFCKHNYIYEKFPEWESKRCDKCEKYKVLSTYKQ